jgi:hypothetical protein
MKKLLTAIALIAGISAPLHAVADPYNDIRNNPQIVESTMVDGLCDPTMTMGKVEANTNGQWTTFKESPFGCETLLITNLANGSAMFQYIYRGSAIAFVSDGSWLDDHRGGKYLQVTKMIMPDDSQHGAYGRCYASKVTGDPHPYFICWAILPGDSNSVRRFSWSAAMHSSKIETIK